MKTTLAGCLALSLLIMGGQAHAEIYTWIDAQGVRHYSDSPTSGHAKRADLPGIQSVDGNPDALARLQAQSQASISDPVGAAAAGLPESRIPELLQPQPEATFRDGQGIVPVALNIGGSPVLQPGEQVTYYLDGSPIPQSPTDQTQLQLGNVPRGTHTLSAALMFQGRELRRTSPVTFYMQPPSAISPLNSSGDAASSDVPGATTAPAAGNSAGAPSAPRINSNAAGAAPTAM